MFALALAMVVVAVALPPDQIQTLPGCNSTCGNIQIPYPFGVGNSSTQPQQPCSLEPDFNLVCNNSNLEWGNISVLSINVTAHQMDVSFWVAVYGILDSNYDEKTYSTGCLTRCYGNNVEIDNGTCSGIGCCQVDIPPRMRNITIAAETFSNSTRDCSHSFVVKQDSKCSDWESRRGEYECKENSHCNDTDTDIGYRCTCDDGYEGNPYLGCTDINECKSTDMNTCINKQNCINTNGSHNCFCPKGQSGNGKKGEGCYHKNAVTKVVIGVAAAILTLFMGTTSLYLIYQKKKLNKLREKYFKQNGGSILLQKLSTRENSSRMTQIFTEEQLKKATNNFDESLIIGSGGFGTVFKGFLENNRIVAIKKSKIVDESQKEHSLTREVPLLVYEFVENGTVFDFLHTQKKVNIETWKTRLRIAAEAAGALSYLHSAASVPIIHRDVKTANILLDNTNTAKVSDFGASRLVPLDQTEIATMVQEDHLFDVLQVDMVNEENEKEIIEVAILAARCLRYNGEERPSMKEL
ncbi:hypothetical protein Fmac_032271 [Flemingia macrophylla]|uniref:Uncharacterized protein n=1 Tax=Flemingia macrophylla TaxID=520843 RepID=A0ABD1L5S7_9FABA